VPVQVAVGTDVHHDIVDIDAAAETPRKFVADSAGTQAEIQHFAAAIRADRQGEFVQLAVRPIRDRVKQRRHDVRSRV